MLQEYILIWNVCISQKIFNSVILYLIYTQKIEKWIILFNPQEVIHKFVT